MRGIHVLLVPAWWPSPEQPMNGVFFADYADAFRDAGAKVGVVYPDLVALRHLFGASGAPWSPRVVEERCAGDVPVYRVRGLHSSFRRPGRRMRTFREWLRRGWEAYVARHGQPDVVQAMCAIPAGWACTHMDAIAPGRVVVTEHTGPFALAMSPPAAGAFVREALGSAGAVVAVSEWTRSQMGAAGITREIGVCGNPVTEAFTRTEVVARRPGSILRGLLVGRVTREKGVEELARAAGALRVGRPVEWHIVGDGPAAAGLKSAFAAGGQTVALVMHGVQERAAIARLMTQCDFFVLPSHGESFGLAVAEALCMGLPVVTTRGTACESFVGDGDGVLVDARSAESLGAGLTHMIDALERFERPAIAGRARKRFSADAVAEWYAGLYRRVMAKS